MVVLAQRSSERVQDKRTIVEVFSSELCGCPPFGKWLERVHMKAKIDQQVRSVEVPVGSLGGRVRQGVITMSARSQTSTKRQAVERSKQQVG